MPDFFVEINFVREWFCFSRKFSNFPWARILQVFVGKLAVFVGTRKEKLAEFAWPTNSARNSAPATAASAGWLSVAGWLAGRLAGGWLGGGMASWLAWLAGWRAGSCEEVFVLTTILAPGACGSGVTPRPHQTHARIDSLPHYQKHYVFAVLLQKGETEKKAEQNPFFFQARLCW